MDDLVAKLRRQGRDDAAAEVKASAQKLSTDIWDSVSAFANTHGGLLVLGLSETDGFRPVTDFALDRVLDQLIEGMGQGGVTGAKLTHPPAFTPWRLLVDGAPVLVVEIAENQAGHKPCFVTAKGVQGGSFKRVDDKNIRLSTTEIFELQHVSRTHRADRDVVPEADVTDLDSRLVQGVLQTRQSSRALHGVNSEAEALTRLNITDKLGGVRLAGLLTLGRYPQQFFPRLLVDVTVHPTNEKSQPGVQLRFLDRVECDGALAEVVEAAVDATAKNLRTYTVVAGAGRQNQLEIPVEVIREAIANAVVHREYHPLFQGHAVSVDIYPDRVTITNPGGLWGGKTLENIDDGESKCRNQTLMQLLQHVPLKSGAGHVAEGQGGGVRLMINEMVAHALERPIFRATHDQVTVELRRHGAEVPEHRKWLRDNARDLSPYEDAALLQARREGHVSVSMLRTLLKIDSDEARGILRRLMADSMLRPRGPEDYVLSHGIPGQRGVDHDVLDVLSPTEPLGINEIALATRRTPNALRPVLRRLVTSGRVRATAPPTSRHRRYLRVD